MLLFNLFKISLNLKLMIQELVSFLNLDKHSFEPEIHLFQSQSNSSQKEGKVFKIWMKVWKGYDILILDSVIRKL